jgi:hypothetical protein
MWRTVFHHDLDARLIAAGRALSVSPLPSPAEEPVTLLPSGPVKVKETIARAQ